MEHSINIRPKTLKRPVEISHIFHLQLILQVHPVSLSHFDFWLKADRILHMAVLLPAAQR